MDSPRRDYTGLNTLITKNDMFVVAESWTGPFLIIGPVTIGCGAILFLFSVETCLKLRKNLKRIKDPEIDKLKNLHQIKHWIHPGKLISQE